jgi:hypothetical protein
MENNRMSFEIMKSSKQRSNEGVKILRSVTNEGYDITHPSGFRKFSNIHIYDIPKAS